MPHLGHSPTPAELAQLVENAPFPICPAYDAQASKAVIHCLKPRHPTPRLFQRYRWQAEG
jgi:hypothetical protein